MMFSQQLNTHRLLKRLAKALIRLCLWAGWSEALLVAHTTMLEIPCHSSLDFPQGVTLMYVGLDPIARLLVQNHFVEHDNPSNTTAGRKKRPSPTLGRFYFYLKYDTLSKKNRPSVGLCFFRNKYQNILPGIGHYKKSEWLTRLLGSLSSLVRVLAYVLPLCIMERLV